MVPRIVHSLSTAYRNGALRQRVKEELCDLVDGVIAGALSRGSNNPNITYAPYGRIVRESWENAVRRINELGEKVGGKDNSNLPKKD